MAYNSGFFTKTDKGLRARRANTSGQLRGRYTSPRVESGIWAGVGDLMRSVLTILANAGKRLSVNSLHQVIASLPIEREQVDEA